MSLEESIGSIIGGITRTLDGLAKLAEDPHVRSIFSFEERAEPTIKPPEPTPMGTATVGKASDSSRIPCVNPRIHHLIQVGWMITKPSQPGHMWLERSLPVDGTSFYRCEPVYRFEMDPDPHSSHRGTLGS